MGKPTNKQIRRNPALFAKTFLKILNKQMQIQPFVFNTMQADYISKRTHRDLILKPRQIGFSTLIQAELFRYVVTRTARVTTIGKDAGNTNDLRALFNRYYEHIPESLNLQRSISNATETVFPQFDSRAIIAKAGNTSSGRGGTNYAVHLSEVAFYRDADTLMQGITQAGNPNWIVCESTANGQQGWFYDAVMEAHETPHLTNWHLHFYAWFDFPQYRLEVPDGFDIHALKPDEHEQMLIKQHNVDIGQLLWRRDKIRELRSTALFDVEYPFDIASAFKFTGSSVFIVEDENLRQVDEMPTPYEGRFAGGIDWGRENDFTSLSIFDIRTGEEVYINRWQKPHTYADMWRFIAHAVCEWQCETVYCEWNSIGAVNASQLEATIFDRWSALGNELHTAPSVEKFVTTQKTKSYAVDEFKQALSARDITLLDVDYATRELRAYQETVSANNLPSFSHPNGGHDDTVMARMIAWVAVLRAYRTLDELDD